MKIGENIEREAMKYPIPWTRLAPITSFTSEMLHFLRTGRTTRRLMIPSVFMRTLNVMNSSWPQPRVLRE